MHLYYISFFTSSVIGLTLLFWCLSPLWMKELHSVLMKLSLSTDHQPHSPFFSVLCLPSFTFHWIRETRAVPCPCIYVCPSPKCPGWQYSSLKTIRCYHFILGKNNNPCTLTRSRIKTNTPNLWIALGVIFSGFEGAWNTNITKSNRCKNIHIIL